ncbi:MAG: hypothetical protein V3V25_08170 [Paracoccaceae bacterium]
MLLIVSGKLGVGVVFVQGAGSAFVDLITSSFWSRFGRSILVAVVTCLWAISMPVNSATNKTIIVHDDRGGGVVERARLIQTYQTDGIRIEIRGNYCLSACTMYLSLRETCVLPKTKFGFHGPSSRLYGISLSPDSFEHWSQVMARHYPEPLRTWFIDEGRYRTVGFYEFSGRDLINMGISRCKV